MTGLTLQRRAGRHRRVRGAAGAQCTRPRDRGTSPDDRLWSPAMVAVCLGYFMVILDSTIVNVAVPALRTGLHADAADLEWVIDGYLLMLAALLLTGGALADRLGARRIFTIASTRRGASPLIRAALAPRC